MSNELRCVCSSMYRPRSATSYRNIQPEIVIRAERTKIFSLNLSPELSHRVAEICYMLREDHLALAPGNYDCETISNVLQWDRCHKNKSQSMSCTSRWRRFPD